jgi:nucleotide-binding universal stress UspA family protein
MSANIIVSYDGTANEDDAIALGGLFARAGAKVSLAYVRHTQEPDLEREQLAQHEAQALLERGAQLLGAPVAGTHAVTGRSTPEALRALAEQIGADAVVFCSDSHTAPSHVTIGNSAERLLDGGPIAVAIAPAELAETEGGRFQVNRIVAVGEAGGSGGAQATAESLAGALGAEVVPVADDRADLLVIDSRADAQPGQVSLSSSAEHLIEIATSPVLVLPAGVSLPFGATSAVAV